MHSSFVGVETKHKICLYAFRRVSRVTSVHLRESGSAAPCELHVVGVGGGGSDGTRCVCGCPAAFNPLGAVGGRANDARCRTVGAGCGRPRPETRAAKRKPVGRRGLSADVWPVGPRQIRVGPWQGERWDASQLFRGRPTEHVCAELCGGSRPAESETFRQRSVGRSVACERSAVRPARVRRFPTPRRRPCGGARVRRGARIDQMGGQSVFGDVRRALFTRVGW